MIVSRRLVLEPLEVRHADALFEILQDLRLYDFIADDPPANITSLRERYARLQKRKSPDATECWLNWAVYVPAQRRYVGYVQATVTPNAVATIAYVVSAEVWGRGYGRESVEAMLGHLWRHYELDAIRATVDPRNVRSIAVLERLGFRKHSFREQAESIRGVMRDEAEYEKTLRILP